MQGSHQGSLNITPGLTLISYGFRNLAFLKAELHPVDIYPKDEKKDKETNEKRKVDECEKERKVHADLKYNLIQTSGVYIWNPDIGKVQMNLKKGFFSFSSLKPFKILTFISSSAAKHYIFAFEEQPQ